MWDNLSFFLKNDIEELLGRMSGQLLSFLQEINILCAHVLMGCFISAFFTIQAVRNDCFQAISLQLRVQSSKLKW